MAISAALQRVYANPTAKDHFIETLEIAHPVWPAEFFITNWPEAFDGGIESGGTASFLSVPFQVVTPKRNTQGRQDMSVAIDNVGRVVMDALEEAIEDPTSPIDITWRVYLFSDLTQPQNNPPLKLTMTDVEVNNKQLVATASRADILNRPFPSEVYRTDQWPGLAR